MEDKLKAVYKFLLKYDSLCSAHSVDFFVCNHWENVVRKLWPELELKLPSDDCFLGLATEAGVHPCLEQFFHESRELRLPGLLAREEGVRSSNGGGESHRETTNTDSSEVRGEERCVGISAAMATRDKLSVFGMSHKKCHEVGVFSELVATQVAAAGVTQVLDVGSGRGYLSEYLSLCHSLTVVGVDSQLGNTHSASNRNKKVHKVWKKSAKRADQDIQPHLTRPNDTMQDHREGVEVSLEQLFESGGLRGSEDNDPLPNIDGHRPIIDNLLSARDNTSSTAGDPLPNTDTPLSTPSFNQPITEHKIDNERQSDNLSSPESCPSRGSPSIERENSNSSGQTNRTRKEVKDTSSYYPVTMEITPGNIPGLLRAAEEGSGGVFQRGSRFAIVGLHTCGDLACSALRVFAAVPQATCLCVVGCCYHHISEHDTTQQQQQQQGVASGFPMSDSLKALGAGLGRKSRMLACQTITRFRETTTGGPLIGIFWRAVLQVVFLRKYPEIYKARSTSLTTGRLKKGLPQDFVSYARIQIPRVGLCNSQVSDAELRSIEQEFLPRKLQLEFYLKLRVILAPCIESIIIMDRLLFLKQMEDVARADVRAVFDPALSPRCLAIVAHKHHHGN